ncbi:Protein ALWAYS EARLY like [Actinidia chinensis var. chinensis]|uniref:Protein ALWAYS EARLY like n=1 Tax=Actinidia chinensis var. chinensis TaxID=1590841 RepID=A0A2R6PK49_ACTCC|nr:Protein ALWAYS EARLY like [Actinidia chinensis var. chinensis]
MAPTRKSRSVNKRFSYVNEVSPSKDGENAKKSLQRKRKLSDMLGLRWSEEELGCFYEAYRKYGQDWEKVATLVRDRSVEMVEALYVMNKAYLSLPEGTASVVGLIAMMTDHYCNLGGSDSEQDSNDRTEASRKSQKCGRGTFRPNTSVGSDGHFLLHSQPVASSYGFLSLPKKRRSLGSRPRVVGKRTPRFPVSYSYEKVNGEKFFSPTRQSLKLKPDANDDDVAHEVALALAEASQKGGSPQVSQTPNRRTRNIMSSPNRNVERMRAELELTNPNLGNEMDENGFKGSMGSMEADNGDFADDRNYLIETKVVGPSELRKQRRLHGKKLEIDDSGYGHLDDIREACSGTEGGQNLGAFSEKLDFEVANRKLARSSSQVSRKKSKKALFGKDEGSPFDALQTLADLSLMMPATIIEDESSVQVKEEEDDLVHMYGSLETLPASHQRNRLKSSGVKAKGNQLRFGTSSIKTSKLRKSLIINVSAIPEEKEEPQQSTAILPGMKQKMLTSKVRKIPTTEAPTDTQPSQSQPAEPSDGGKKLISKGKRSCCNISQKKQGKSARHPELSSSSSDMRKEKDNTALSTVQVPNANEVKLRTKVRSRRKTELQKPRNLNDLKFSNKFLDGNRSNLPVPSVHDASLNLKDKLSNSLSNNHLRRWCAFEWFYSAIDYPWFAKREFVEYLNHVGLGHVPRLTRVEWGVIKSSLGKPRRFSKQFLKEEKEKLNHYRDSVRTHYTELRAGTREGLPTDLAKPLSVGQRVMAIHPRTKQIHDGNVLTVDHSRCRVQFDRTELGVEFVQDIDCMPLNPLENMPASLARNMVTVDKLFENFNELKMNGWAKDQRLDGYIKHSPGENLENVDVSSHVSPSTYPTSNLLKQAKGATTDPNSQAKIGTKETATNQQAPSFQPSILAQIQGKQADVQALAELTRVLDKKEAVVSELRHMNDDVLENQKDGDNTLKDTEPFKKQYAAILVQLNEVNEQVSSALCSLRQRNTYQGSFPLTLPRTASNLGEAGGSFSLFDQTANHPQESGSHVHEIVESSRTKARTMVDAAMQAISSSTQGGNTLRIEEAIDYVSNQLSMDDSCLMTTRSTPADPIHSSSASNDLLTFCCTLNSLHSSESKNVSDRNDARIPSELISHCVATLLMIQKCTERQFPPADVAQILDSAVDNLQPCCSQNLPVYSEIRKCMGIIRNQILALVPTQALYN